MPSSRVHVGGISVKSFAFPNQQLPSIYFLTVTESASAVDTQDDLIIAVQTITETASALDILDATSVLSPTVTETVSALDILNTADTINVSITETVSALDTQDASTTVEILVGGKQPSKYRRLQASSHLHSVSYDESTAKLQVKFNNGKIYSFDKVPPKVIDKIVDAKSAGKTFVKTVKNKFDHSRIGF